MVYASVMKRPHFFPQKSFKFCFDYDISWKKNFFFCCAVKLLRHISFPISETKEVLLSAEIWKRGEISIAGFNTSAKIQKFSFLKKKFRSSHPDPTWSFIWSTWSTWRSSAGRTGASSWIWISWSRRSARDRMLTNPLTNDLWLSPDQRFLGHFWWSND